MHGHRERERERERMEEGELGKRMGEELVLVGNEIVIYERLMYKNKNQHRGAIYFRHLLQVRRDLRLLQAAKLKELVDTSLGLINATNEGKVSEGSIIGLRNGKRKAIVGSGFGSKQKTSRSGKSLDDLKRRLLGVTRLIQQMFKPLLKAAMHLAGLLGQTFFMPFALTAFSCLARFRTLLQQVLNNTNMILNMLSSVECKASLAEKNDCQPKETTQQRDLKNQEMDKAEIKSHNKELIERTEGLGQHIQWYVDDRSGQKFQLFDASTSDCSPSDIPVPLQTIADIMASNATHELFQSESKHEEDDMKYVLQGSPMIAHDVDNVKVDTESSYKKRRVAYVSVGDNLAGSIKSVNPKNIATIVSESEATPPDNVKKNVNALFDMLLGKEEM